MTGLLEDRCLTFRDHLYDGLLFTYSTYTRYQRESFMFIDLIYDYKGDGSIAMLQIYCNILIFDTLHITFSHILFIFVGVSNHLGWKMKKVPTTAAKS